MALWDGDDLSQAGVFLVDDLPNGDMYFLVVDGDLFSWNLKDDEGNNNREIGYILIHVCFLSYSLKKRV